MTKEEMVEKMLGFPELSTPYMARVIDQVLWVIMEQAKSPGGCRVPGFGTFRVVERKARTGRIVKTGEPVEIPARRAVKFTAAKAFKTAVQR